MGSPIRPCLPSCTSGKSGSLLKSAKSSAARFPGAAGGKSARFAEAAAAAALQCSPCRLSKKSVPHSPENDDSIVDEKDNKYLSGASHLSQRGPSANWCCGVVSSTVKKSTKKLE